MPILRELITILGFKADDKVLKAYDRKISDLKKNLFLLTGAAVAAGAAIFGLAESAARAGDVLDKTKDLTGLSVEQLQELGGAAKLAGIDVQGLTTGMQLFSRQISQAAQGQQMSLRAFELLHISIFGVNDRLKSNHQLLLEVADAFKGLHDQQLKTDLALQLFGRSGGRMINLLKNGAAGVREAEKEFSKFGFTLNEAQAKAGAKFQDQLTKIGFAVKGLKNAIGMALLPAISQLTNKFLDWFAANKKIITQNMIQIFKDLAKFVRVVVDIMGAMISVLTIVANAFGGWNRILKITGVLLAFMVSTKLIRGFMGLGQAVLGLVGIFKKLVIVEGIADALAAIWPAIAIALFLIFDDIKNFIQGNNSLIGKFIEKFPALGKVLLGIGFLLKWLAKVSWETFKIVFVPLEITYILLSKIYNILQKLTGQKHLFGAIAKSLLSFGTYVPMPTMGVAAPLMAGGGGARTQAITTHVNTNVNLSVPEGTPDQQKGFLRQMAEQTFNKVIDKHLKEAQARFPVME